MVAVTGEYPPGAEVLRSHAVRVVVPGGAHTVIGHHYTAEEAVTHALEAATAKAGTPIERDGIVWVRRAPLCEWCASPASRYDRGSSDDTPLCISHAYNEYPNAEDRRTLARPLGISRYEAVPDDKWMGERPS
jgi:hypothetical protein